MNIIKTNIAHQYDKSTLFFRSIKCSLVQIHAQNLCTCTPAHEQSANNNNIESLLRMHPQTSNTQYIYAQSNQQIRTIAGKLTRITHTHMHDHHHKVLTIGWKANGEQSQHDLHTQRCVCGRESILCGHPNIDQLARLHSDECK